MEADLAPMTRPLGSSEFADGSNDGGELSVVRADAGVEFGELGRNDLVVDDQQAEANKGPDDMDAHFGGGVAVENIGGLDGSVFGEGVGKETRIAVLL